MVALTAPRAGSQACPVSWEPEVPFGGYKQSGLHRETGIEGLMEFLQTKHISLQLTDSFERVRR